MDGDGGEKAVFLELSVRCTLLAGIAIFSTYLCYAITIAMAVLIEIENAIAVWPGIVISCDCAVSGTCVYLFFKFNVEKYYKICHCGHECVKTWKVKKLDDEMEMASRQTSA